MIYVSIKPKVDKAEEDALALINLLREAEEGTHPTVSREYARIFRNTIMCGYSPRG